MYESIGHAGGRFGAMTAAPGAAAARAPRMLDDGPRAVSGATFERNPGSAP